MKRVLLFGWLLFLILWNIGLYGQPVVRTWQGANNDWGNTNNWSPNGFANFHYLVWDGSGLTTSNNTNADPLVFYRRLTFNGFTSYLLGGNTIRILDDIDGTSQGSILQQSTVLQTISAPVFFDDNSRVGLIETRSSGGILLSNTLQLGAGLTSLNVSGEFTSGTITVNGSISGTSSINIGLNSIGETRSNTRVIFGGDNTGFSGTIAIRAGQLSFTSSKADGVSAINPIEIYPGGLLQLASIMPGPGITLSGKTIKIMAGGASNVPTISSSTGNNSITSDILVNSNTTINAINGTTLDLGNIGFESADLTLTVFNNSNILNETSKISLNGSLGILNGIPLLNLTKRGSGILYLNCPVSLSGALYVPNNSANPIDANEGDNSVAQPWLNNVVELGGDDLISPTATLEMQGGVFRTGNFKQTFKAFSQTQGNRTSWIELGNAAELTFGNSNMFPITGRVLIKGWTGTVGTSGTGGNIFIQKQDLATEGLTEDQLLKINFEGYSSTCAGAKLIPTVNPLISELVPAPAHAITSVQGANIAGLLTGNLRNDKGYIGGAITISGCRFVNAANVTSVTIGGTPVVFTVPTTNQITITNLSPNVSGVITVVANSGQSVSWGNPFVNLGYITTGNGTNNWQTNAVWLGGASFRPSSTCCNNNRITINGNRQVLVDGATTIPNLNPGGPPYTNELTINSGASIRLSAASIIPNTTPLVLNGGSFRNFNSLSNVPASSLGQRQVLGTLKLTATSSIALGSGFGVNNEIHFSASDLITWTPNARLEIYNWTGSYGGPGTAGRIFFDNPGGLTAEQLKQISFVGLCGQATLIAGGELVPSTNPEITSVSGNPGIVNGVYIGGEVNLNGCLMDNVTQIKVGSVTLIKGSHGNAGEFTGTSAQITFIFTEPMDGGNIELFTGISPAFVLRETIPSFKNLGYLSKASGDWNNSSVWLGTGNVPTAARNVTILAGHTIEITNNVISELPDTLFIDAGATLELDDEIELNVNKRIANNGQLVTGDKSIIKLAAGGSLVNNGTFNSGLEILHGTFSFEGNGTLSGSNAITFSKLQLNSGTVNLPLLTDAFPSIPTIRDSLIMNGGAFRSNNANAVGPKYGANSTLVYRSGGNTTRGVEWHSTQSATIGVTEGYPNDVRIENGSNLSLKNNSISAPPRPTEALPNLTVGGNLHIVEGNLFNNFLEPPYSGVVEIMKNVIQGSANPSVIATLTLDENNSLARLNVYGNFTRSYFTNSLNYGNRITFKGGNATNITLAGSGGLTDLEVSKTNPGTITLNSMVSVNRALFLSNGIINTDLSLGRVLQVEAGASITGGSSSSFVNGALRKMTDNSETGTLDFEFKIGKVLPTTVYKPVWVADIQPNGNTSFTAEYFPSSTTDLPNFSGPFFIDPTLTGIWANEWWSIDRSGSGKARVGIYYSPLPPSAWVPTPPCIDCNVAVVHYNAGTSSWEFTKSSGNFNNATPPYFEAILHSTTNAVYSDVETGYSPFTIGFSYPSVLSIKLIGFSAQLQNGDGLLNWQVSDINTLKHFDVEHSTDGVRFQRLSTITPAENNAFQYLHRNLTTGIHYYRLKMFEKNGRYSYSRIEWIQVGTQQTIISGLLQNPVFGGQAVVKLYSANAQSAEAMVIDRSGRVMLRQGLTIQQGNNQVNISILPLSRGSYFLKLRTKDGVEKVMPFIK